MRGQRVAGIQNKENGLVKDKTRKKKKVMKKMKKQQRRSEAEKNKLREVRLA